MTCSIVGKYSFGSKGSFSAKYASNGLLVAEYFLNGSLASDVENVGLNLGYTVNTTEEFQSVKVGGKFHNENLHMTSSVSKFTLRSQYFLDTWVNKFIVWLARLLNLHFIRLFLFMNRANFDTNVFSHFKLLFFNQSVVGINS